MNTGWHSNSNHAARQPPPAVDGYELFRCIGEGSCGQVWLARNIMQEWRAVKVVHRSRFENDSRLYEREFNGLRQYEPISRSHGSLVQVLHMGRNEELGFFFYIMELADDAASDSSDGRTATLNPETYAPRTLSHDLKSIGRLAPARCVEIGVALATALEQLHKGGLVHRDIKPTNIIFVNGQPKLADIGLVTRQDATRSFAGTLGYVAPEGPGEPSADIYSLGKVLYEMSTGRNRFDYPAFPDMGQFSESDRNGLWELNAIYLKACTENRTARHRSATELKEEFVRLSLGDSIRRQHALERMVRRMKKAALWGAALLTLGGLGLGLWFYRARSIEQSRNVLFKQEESRRAWGGRSSGWFFYNWTNFQQAASLRIDAELLGQAASSLSGVDAGQLCSIDGFGGVGAAFAEDGTALVGSDGTGPGLLIAPNGVTSELPVRDIGPVSWTAEGVPVQVSAHSSGCVLKNMRDGTVISEWPTEDGDTVAEGVGPVLALASDGRWAAAGLRGERPRVVLWETATSVKQGEASLRATSLAFSEDGTRLVAGCEDGTIHIYSVSGMEPKAVLSAPTRSLAVRFLALAPDRQVSYDQRDRAREWLIAAGYEGGEIGIWETRSGLARSWCRGSHWTVTALAFHPDGQTLASAGRNLVRLWDIMTSQVVLSVGVRSSAEGTALAIDREGRRMVFGTRPNAAKTAVELWEFSPHHGIQLLCGLTAGVRQIWFSDDGRLIAGLSDDWRVAVWDTTSGWLLHLLETPAGTYADSAGGAFDKDNMRFGFCTGTEACVYDLEARRVTHQWKMPISGKRDQLQFDKRGHVLVARSVADHRMAGRRSWRMYELEPGVEPKELCSQAETDREVAELVLAAGGERLFSRSLLLENRHSLLQCFDTRTGRELWNMPSNGSAEDAFIGVDPLGGHFAYAPLKSQPPTVVRLLDFAEVRTLSQYCRAIGPAGGRSAMPSFEGWVMVTEDSPAEQFALGPAWGMGYTPRFSPKGDLFAWSGENRVLLAHLDEVRQRLASLKRGK